jgi:hypothetical protein
MRPRTRLTANRYAYVFYATNDTYAIAVLVFVRLLRQIGVREDADIVLLHLELSPRLAAKARAMGVHTRQVAPLPYVSGSGYEDCLVKLRIFDLTEYERIVYVDADSIPLRRLDALFDLEFDELVAAPTAYWLPQPFWGSYLLVVKPAPALWKRVSRHFESASQKGFYDMDIINAELGGEIRTLPHGIVCLNSEWECMNKPRCFDDLGETYANASLIHFTGLGKPWFYTVEDARRMRPDAHLVFYDLWEKWWRARSEIFTGGELDRAIFLGKVSAHGASTRFQRH